MFEGVLVWVDPIADRRDRSKLDPMLRDLADRGVWVSAYPDVVQKIGTEEVLYRTALSTSDGERIRTSMRRRPSSKHTFLARLRSSGPRLVPRERLAVVSGGTMILVIQRSTRADQDVARGLLHLCGTRSTDLGMSVLNAERAFVRSAVASTVLRVRAEGARSLAHGL